MVVLHSLALLAVISVSDSTTILLTFNCIPLKSVTMTFDIDVEVKPLPLIRKVAAIKLSIGIKPLMVALLIAIGQDVWHTATGNVTADVQPAPMILIFSI